ncbi:MAG: hypothetical protein O4859_18575 [Trichodesmium sp. St18_bin1]|nr:hypothetical protein [Trichodesmium sp. St18_bin1]MDE5118462.1 hypothetical protein [Trichodesmium sp. St2_bin2_1]MDE5119967.1 hypothetical protein [Trichodesmium sp. St19_bin1]
MLDKSELAIATSQAQYAFFLRSTNIFSSTCIDFFQSSIHC